MRIALQGMASHEVPQIAIKFKEFVFQYVAR
jgi:hypothetical protein